MSPLGPPSSSGQVGASGKDGHTGGTDTGGEIPWAFIDCPTDTLILLISHMLNLLIQHNDQVVLTPDSLTRFHSRAAPGISVLEYLRRIVKYTNMEKIPLLSLLAYIDITCQHLPSFTLSSLTVHRFLIAGVCAGSKAQCDVFCTNAHYAKVGGIKVQELNALEREFLKVTQWNLCCNADLLQRYYTSLIRSHGGYTQASEPSTRPFLSFPRSMSKPREEDDEEMEEDEDDEEQEGDNDEEDENVEVEDGDVGSISSTKRRSLDVSGMVVVQTGQDEIPSAPIPIALADRGKRRLSERSGQGDSVEPSGHADGEAVEMEVDQSPPSPATSSIPSSSRSSIRGGSRGSRGRAVSLSYTDARIAEPQLDRATASGSPFTSTRDSASTSPLSHFTSTRDVSSQNSSAGSGNLNGSSEPVSHDSHQPVIGDEHAEHHHHHHHMPGAHLLKSLGGIFHRRKSHNTDKPPIPSAFPPVHAQPTTHDSSNGVHLSFAEQPKRHYTHTSEAGLPPPPVPQNKPTPSQSTLPPLASPASTTAQRVQPKSRENSLARSPRTMKSPGMAKAVTPRIRMREELSESDLHDLHGMGTLGEVGIAADDGNRRARVE